jgi:hypothetical protein
LGKTKIDLEKTKANVNDLFIKLNGISLFYWKLNFNFLNCSTPVTMMLVLTEAKQESVKARADFIETVDDLSSKLNGIFC